MPPTVLPPDDLADMLTEDTRGGAVEGTGGGRKRRGGAYGGSDHHHYPAPTPEPSSRPDAPTTDVALTAWERRWIARRVEQLGSAAQAAERRLLEKVL